MNVESLSLSTSRGATTAYVTRPPEKADAGVLLIQEWWGINDHIRDLAGRYADEGYLCVAPDLYRARVTKDKEEASALMHALEIEDGLETIRAALTAAEETYGVNKFAITGYCMGGTFALRAACEMPELKAAAPFYGDIPEEDVLQKLTVPTLFIAGKRDAWINPEKGESVEGNCGESTTCRLKRLATTPITLSLTIPGRRFTTRKRRRMRGQKCRRTSRNI